MKNQELSLFVGSKIKEFRKSQKLTQAELSEKAGVGKSTIANYEKGYRSPNQDTLFLLADVFGVSINDFFPPINSISTLQTHPTQTTELPSTVAKLNSELNQDNHTKWVDYGTALLEEQEETVEELGLTQQVNSIAGDFP